MHKETVTIEVDVPDGYKLTGEYRQSRHGEYVMDCWGEVFYEQRQRGSKLIKYFILETRATWTLPDWLAWLPDDCWLYRNNYGCWTVSNMEPTTVMGCGSLNGLNLKERGTSLDIAALLRVIDQIWNPPPVDCIRIRDARKGVVKHERK